MGNLWSSMWPLTDQQQYILKTLSTVSGRQVLMDDHYSTTFYIEGEYTFICVDGDLKRHKFTHQSVLGAVCHLGNVELRFFAHEGAPKEEILGYMTPCLQDYFSGLDLPDDCWIYIGTCDMSSMGCPVEGKDEYLLTLKNVIIVDRTKKVLSHKWRFKFSKKGTPLQKAEEYLDRAEAEE